MGMGLVTPTSLVRNSKHLTEITGFYLKVTLNKTFDKYGPGNTRYCHTSAVNTGGRQSDVIVLLATLLARVSEKASWLYFELAAIATSLPASSQTCALQFSNVKFKAVIRLNYDNVCQRHFVKYKDRE